MTIHLHFDGGTHDPDAIAKSLCETVWRLEGPRRCTCGHHTAASSTKARRRALTHLALACVAVLALVALVACGPSDADIESSVAVSGETTTTVQPRVRIAAIDGPVVFDIPTLPPTTAAPASSVPPHSAPVTTTAPPAPPLTAVAPAPGGDCGGWEGLVASYFPGEVAFACSVMMCESQGNPSAVSRTDDHGLWQLNRPSWERRFAEVTGVAWSAGVYDPELNTRFAAWLRNEAGWGQWVCAR